MIETFFEKFSRIFGLLAMLFGAVALAAVQSGYLSQATPNETLVMVIISTILVLGGFALFVASGWLIALREEEEHQDYLDQSCIGQRLFQTKES